MSLCRMAFSSLVMLLTLAAAPYVAAQEHFRFARTDNNNSILMQAATLDGELLVAGDEVGVFTPQLDDRDAFCAGATAVDEDGFSIGMACWGDEAQAEGINGFLVGEEISFRVWDHENDEEWPAEVTQIVQGGEDGRAIYRVNGFVVLRIAAERLREAAIAVDPAELDFGAMGIGVEAELALTVSSVGGADLEVSEMTINVEQFGVNFEEEAVIAPGESVEYTVTFSSDEEGQFSGVLTIVSNDPENGELEIRLLAVAQPAQPPIIRLSPPALNFGRILVGEDRVLSIDIINDGDEPLTVDEVSTGDEVFTTDFEGEVELAAGERFEINVTFTPEEIQAYAADLVVHSDASNADDDGNFSARLVGEGLDPEGSPEIQLAIDQHFFGKVVLGRSADWRLAIRNVGARDLFINSVESDNEVFTTDFDQEARLRPDDIYNLTVTFTPDDDEAFYNGILTIGSDDPENGEVEVRLRGVGGADNGRHFQFHNTGTNHSILVQSASLDGEDLVEGDEVGVFTTWNLCAGAGVIDEEGRSGLAAMGDDDPNDGIINGFVADEEFSFMVWDADADLEAWGVADYQVGRDTWVENGFSVVTIEAHAEDQPNINLSADQHFFRQAVIDQDEHEWDLIISNRGRGLLEVESVESDENDIRVAFEGPVELEFQAQIAVTVTFAPTEERDYVARLTIVSNDPDDGELYVDIFGQGVEEINEPNATLSAVNHFYGVLHVDGDYVYTLEVGNDGGGALRLEAFARAGAAEFVSDFPDNVVSINPGEAHEITITFSPRAQQGQQQDVAYNATFTLQSNDPDSPEIAFPIRGYGSVSEDHFLHLNTGVTHLLLVNEATIVTLQGDEVPIAPGDEIAVFTPQGLCAGHIVADEEGAPYGFTAQGDDLNTNFIDGFRRNEQFTFMIYDWTTRDELVVPAEGVNRVQGPAAFAPNAQSVFTLIVDAEHDEARIAAEPMEYMFGPLTVNQMRSTAFTITNEGGLDLTVSRVTSNRQVFTTDFDPDNPVVLEPDESFELTVNFRPAAPLAYVGDITIESDDPDDPNFIITALGMGSDFAGHNAFYRTDVNHNILIQRLVVGEGLAARNDEVAVFTEAGFCAGATIIQEPGPQVGIAAWGDDANTQRIIEGFVDRETMEIRFWDFGQRREYSGENIEIGQIRQGTMNWTGNGLTVIAEVTISGIWGIIPPELPERIDEGDEVAFDLQILDPPGDMDFELENADVLPEGADFDLDFADNVGHFRWQTDFDVVSHENPQNLRRTFALNFAVSDEDGNEDRIIVELTVFDVNRPPELSEAAPDPFELIDGEVFLVIDEGADWLAPAVRLDELFVDHDGDRLTYWAGRFRQVGGNPVLQQQLDQNQRTWNVRAHPQNINFFGDAGDTLYAEDNFGGGMAPRLIRSVFEEPEADANARSLRRVDAQPGDEIAPPRDVIFRFIFTVRVNPVNDPPVIAAPAQEPHRVSVDEGQQLVVQFDANDLDNADDELEWTVSDPNGLPEEGWTFTDNNNSTASFEWNTTFDDAGVYTPVFQVTDGVAQVTRTVEITVRNRNQPPVVVDDQMPADPFEVSEDPGQVVNIVDLDDLFNDPDGEQLDYVFAGAPDEFDMDIDPDNVLNMLPIANYNLPAGAEITVRGTDPGGLFAEASFRVVVTPVNDPPEAFDLLTPPNNLQIAYDPDSLGTVTFTWQVAAQNQWETDEVQYVVTFFAEGAAPEDTMATPPLDSVFYNDIPIQEIAELLQEAPREDGLWVHWHVWALDTDGAPWVLASNADFRFFIPPLGVREDGTGVPDRYFLSDNFPNPFNAYTTIKFGLPKPGDVSVTAWDMHGRQVGLIAGGNFGAGQYEATWRPEGLTSGIYIIRMQAADYRTMRKAILLR